MPTILIIGGTRGLGASLTAKYAADPSNTVYATSRSTPPAEAPAVNWISNIDLMDKNVGLALAKQLPSSTTIDTLIVSAGYFGLESFDEPDWEKEIRMYTTSSVAPVFIVQALVKSGALVKDAKVIFVSSESGSITLRHESEGGGNYAHHASKSALNMVGKLLSLDVKDRGIAIGMVHPGFMRTEMTAGVGFDKYYDDGGAVTPDVAADSLIKWIKSEFDISKTGQYWAPRGPRDIGTAEPVLGKQISEKQGQPLELPW